jgi:hypothetical protein
MENTFFFEKPDIVKMHTFDYGCPPILAQQHQIFKILVSNPPQYHLIIGGGHKNFEDNMMLSLDMRKNKI